MMKNRWQHLLLSGAALCATPVMAQTAEPPTPTPDAPDATSATAAPSEAVTGGPDTAPDTANAGAAEDKAGADITVTGSRIVRDGYTAPTPVTVARVEELVRSTPTNIPDGLNKLPQFSLSSSPSRSTHNFASSGTNGNLLNLRGVGTLRTLILFDGVRLPPTTFRGDVDVNVIPNLLIERVDVVTAGASAGYGSDAVSGIVNFVLNKKFTGLTGGAQYGLSQRGDNQNYRFSLAGGANFAGDRGHILLSAEYFDSKGMLRNDRKQSLQHYLLGGSNRAALLAGSVAGSNGNPLTIYANTTINNATDGGLITSGPFANFRFLPNGQVTPFNIGTLIGTPGYSVGGDGYVITDDSSAVAPLTTYQAFGRLSYDVTDDITAYAQGTFTRSDIAYRSLSNGFLPPAAATIFSGNPYIPANVQTALTNTATPSFGVAESFVYKGALPSKERTDFYMGTAGLDGKFGDWSWNASYVHGRSKLTLAQQTFDIKKAFAAIDAVKDPVTGATTCNVLLNPDPAIRAQYAGCSPLNIFGVGAADTTPAGYAYANGISRYRAVITQDQVQANVQGSLFDLPAGPVDLAFGAEYRRQKLHLTSNSDPALLAASPLAGETTAQTSARTTAIRAAYFAGLRGVPASSLFFNLTNTGIADGRVNVKEAFAEINVPVLKDTPFFQSLELNAAGRITDYSTSGTVKTWKLGGTWKPVDGLLLRATRSRDIRAPALFELYAGDSSGIGSLVDVAVSQGGSGMTSNVPQITGGNRDLKPERAKTLTFGGVVSPSFLPGFSFAADYYRLRIDGLIGTLSITQIVTNCSLSAAAPECALITRPGPNAFPSSIRVAPANIAFLKTAGIDFDASYRTEIGNGQLGLRLYANYLDKFLTRQSATAVVLENAGRGSSANQPIARPKWRGTFNLNYTNGAFGLFVSEQYIGKFDLGFEGATSAINQNQVFVDPKVKPVFYTDLTLSYKVPSMGGDIEMFLTVNNLFDKDPPLIPGTIPGLNLPTIISVYDTVGRAFTFGTRFKF